MKTVLTDIRWDIDFEKDESLMKAFEKKKNEEYEAFMEDWDGEEKFEDVFDREQVQSEILFTKKGLPNEAYFITYTNEEKELLEKKGRTASRAKQKEYGDRIKELDMPSDEELIRLLEEGRDCKVLSFEKHKAERDSELTKIMMKDGLNKLFAENDFQKYLDLSANFDKYSVNNKLLVYAQKPEATLVKGKTQWAENERYLSRGAKSIWINTPVTKGFSIPKDATPDKINETVRKATDYIKEQNDRIGHGGFGYILPEKEKEYLDTLISKRHIEIFTGYTSVAKVYDVADTFGKELPVIQRDKAEPEGLLLALKLAYPQVAGVIRSEKPETAINSVVDTYLHGDEIKVPNVYGTNKNYTSEDRRAEVCAVNYLVSRNYGVDSLADIGDAFRPLRDRYDTADDQMKALKALTERITKTADMINRDTSEMLKYKELGMVQVTFSYDRTFIENYMNGIRTAKYDEKDGNGNRLNAFAEVGFMTTDGVGIECRLYAEDQGFSLSVISGDGKYTVSPDFDNISTPDKFMHLCLEHFEAIRDKALERDAPEEEVER